MAGVCGWRAFELTVPASRVTITPTCRDENAIWSREQSLRWSESLAVVPDVVAATQVARLCSTQAALSSAWQQYVSGRAQIAIRTYERILGRPATNQVSVTAKNVPKITPLGGRLNWPCNPLGS